jgi:hypothetical protein
MKALAWGGSVGVTTGALFGPLSFGVAHGSWWPIFLGAAVAIGRQWPGADSLLGVAVYQFAYCIGVALVIAGALGIFRIRAERLAREKEARSAT